MMTRKQINTLIDETIEERKLLGKHVDVKDFPSLGISQLVLDIRLNTLKWVRNAPKEKKCPVT